MTTITFTIPGRHMGMNEYTAANRTNANVGAKMKRSEQEAVKWVIKASRLPHITGKVRIDIAWYEPNRLRDPDNIASFKKIILDALVESHVINNDGWKYLATPVPFSDSFFVDKDHPRIEVTITSVVNDPIHEREAIR